MKRKKALLNPEDIFPKRFALNYSPPMLILEFNKCGSLYLKKMRIFKLTPESLPMEILDYLKKKHWEYFHEGRIEDKQVLKLIAQLQKNLKKKLDLAASGGHNLNDQQSVSFSMAKE